jgi:hypothetical protein
MSTYGFLTDEEAKIFALNEQRYLIKDIKENVFPNVTGNNRIRLHTTARVCSWVWVFKRNDVYKRNEWSNYSNWDYYRELPKNVELAPDESEFSIQGEPFGPGANPFLYAVGDPLVQTLVKSSTSYYVNPTFTNRNIREILLSLSILFDGKYREFDFDPGVYNYIEKYRNSNGISDNTLYTYSFSLNTSPMELQPSGAINLSRFKTIEFDISTILPEVDPKASFKVLCDAEGTIIGTSQKDSLYVYHYDFYLAEERYNLLRFISGNAALLYAR